MRDRIIYITRTGDTVAAEPPIRRFPFSLFPMRPKPAQYEVGLFVDLGDWEGRLAVGLRDAARRRGWRATTHGTWEKPGPGYDPDTRVDVTISGLTFALIVWDPGRPGEEGWVSAEGLSPELPTEEIFEMVRGVLRAAPGVQVLRDFAPDAPPEP